MVSIIACLGIGMILGNIVWYAREKKWGSKKLAATTIIIGAVLASVGIAI